MDNQAARESFGYAAQKTDSGSGRKVVVRTEEAYGLGSRQRGEERDSAKVGGGRRRERCRDKRRETRGTSYYYCS